ncbi:MAG: hypothetical protein N4A43_02305 [Alphaproteobacteria bacterium]|jgi:hypothetical protein|nr:hypothetical protein [Alphaproteobacteria bacterium]
MKKLIIVLAVMLCSCAIDGSLNYSAGNRNERCADIQKYKVAQVIDTGALAYGCDSSFEDFCHELLVFIPNIKGEMFYDDKIIKAPKNKCIVYNDVFKYETNAGMNKTIPKVKFENSRTEKENK